MLGLAAVFVAGIVWVWAAPSGQLTPQERIPGTLISVLLAGFLVRMAMLRRPILEIHGGGITKGRITVPWGDVVLVQTRSFGRHAAVSVIVHPGTRAFDVLPGPLRWLRLRGSRRRAIWGVRAPIADSRTLPLDAEEVRALFRHPANTGGVTAPGRPDWQTETGKLVGAAGVSVAGRVLIVADADGERLRIDDSGVHGRMPSRRRSVLWADIDRLGLLDESKHAALTLQLRPGTLTDPVREREWRLRDRPGGPALPIPLRGLPFDAVTLTGLILAHPGGGEVWERGRTPEA